MTRLRHRNGIQFGHLRHGIRKNVMNSSIKIIDRLLNPYINALIQNDIEKIRELFTVEVYNNIASKFNLLLAMKENHSAYLQMTNNAIILLKRTLDCHIDSVNKDLQIDSLVTIIEELKSDGSATKGALDITLSLNQNTQANSAILIYHYLYGFPKNGVYELQCIARIIAGTATGNETDCNCGCD